MIPTLILAASLNAGIGVEIDLSGLMAAHIRRDAKEPRVTCGIRVVGYRFIGEPGKRVRYMGRTYEIGSEGYVELIAGRKAPERASAELDQFGFATVMP